MRFILGLILPSVLLGQNAIGPITAVIRMEHESFLIGEPVKALFEAKNTGPSAVGITVGPLEGSCSSYRVRITSTEQNPKTSALGRGGPHEIIAGCPYGAQTLLPGQNYAEHPLLIDRSELTRPGKYHIEVSRYFAYDKPDVLPHLGSPGGVFRARFDITVVDAH